MAEEPVGEARPHSREQLSDSERGQRIARVLGPAQAGERVLDVGGLEEPQPAELHERDVAPPELHLERVAVVRGPEQHRLLPQRHPRLAPLEDLAHDIVDLRELVRDGDHAGRAPPGRAENRRFSWRSAASAITALAASRIGCCRPVILLQRHDVGRRIVLPRELQDVAHPRRPKTVDRLRVVAHDSDPAPVGLDPPQDLGLQRVGVLVLVDEHMIEKGADARRRPRRRS